MQIKLATDSKNHEELFGGFHSVDPSSPPNHLAFLQPTTISNFKNIYFTGETFDVDKKVPLAELKEMWGRVLIDAIYFLRINDHREAPFYDFSTGGKKKTTMSTAGVSNAAKSSVYGIDELSKYFEQFTEFEATLYGVDKYYRDHVTHPVHVWLTGLNILKAFGGQFKIVSSKFAKICDDPHAQIKWFVDDEGINRKGSECLNVSTAELSAMWAIIALTHDIGYPLEKVDKINDQLEAMLAQFGNIGFSRSHFSFENQHDHLVKFLLQLISSVCAPDEKTGAGTEYKAWTNHLRTKYYTKFSKSWEQFDHGIVSCLLLLKTLTFFIESDYSNENNKPLDFEDARQFAIRSEILHAIASHTTPKIYHLAINNLVFLLVFCDDIQEWARPTLNDIRAGLKGNAESVTIEKFNISDEADQQNEIECLVKYQEQDLPDQERFVKRTFQQWLERLRPALDDNIRSFKYTWKVQFGDWPEWSFTLDNQVQDVFLKISLIRVEGPSKSSPMSLVDLDKLGESR